MQGCYLFILTNVNVKYSHFIYTYALLAIIFYVKPFELCTLYCGEPFTMTFSSIVNPNPIVTAPTTSLSSQDGRSLSTFDSTRFTAALFPVLLLPFFQNEYKTDHSKSTDLHQGLAIHVLALKFCMIPLFLIVELRHIPYQILF